VQGSESINLLVAEFKSYGGAFECAQNLSKVGANLLEIGPVTEKGYLLAEVPPEFDNKSFEGLKVPGFDQYTILKKMPSEVLKIYLSLAGKPVQDYILFLKFPNLSQAFKAASEIFSKGHGIVDFRFLKNSPGVCHLIVTSASQTSLQEEKNKYISGVMFKVEGDFIKNYFNLAAPK